MNDMDMLKGKKVLITGAARGLGAAFATILADAGADVIMTGRLTEMLEGTAEAIRLRCDCQPETHLLDLADTGQVLELAETITSSHGKLDILINNGAQWLGGRMDSFDAYAAVSTINSAATGSYLLTRGLMGALKAAGSADILNIVSTAGLTNAALQGASVPFAMAKRAQAAMSDGLRQELRGSDIRVQALYPPDLETISPLNAQDWQAPRGNNQMVTSRDVVEAGIFALTRPRNVALASIVLDGDNRGMFG